MGAAIAREVNDTWGDENADTVMAKLPLTAPEVAVTVTEPACRAVSRPEVLMEATGAAEVFHVTCEVRGTVLPSLKTPCAVNCSVEPCITVVVEPVLVTMIEASIGVPA
jgi:hypothetical protein